MTEAPTLPPLHMRRNAFDPTPELREIREDPGVRTVVNAFGIQVYLVTRHEDVKEVLADHEHFRNSRPPGFVLPGAPAVPEDEQAECQGGQPARPRPAGASAAAPDAHRRVHRPADEAAGTADRRDRRAATRRDAKPGPARRPGGALRTADSVAGDLRVARRPLCRPRRLPAALRPPARPVRSHPRAAGAAASGPRLHALARAGGPARPRRGHAGHAGPRARR